MTYSCVDFTDDILNALKLNIPKEHWDNPSEQADLALEAIDAMQCELAGRRAGWTFDKLDNEYRLYESDILLKGVDANKTWRELCEAHGINPC